MVKISIGNLLFIEFSIGLQYCILGVLIHSNVKTYPDCISFIEVILFVTSPPLPGGGLKEIKVVGFVGLAP